MNWSRFKAHSYHYADLGVSLDISRLPFPDDFLASKEAAMQQAFAAMAALEKGAIANPDEQRMVGHYAGLSESMQILNQLLKEDNDDE